VYEMLAIGQYGGTVHKTGGYCWPNNSLITNHIELTVNLASSAAGGPHRVEPMWQGIYSKAID